MKLKDIKAQPINLLSGNRITTFDKKNNQVIVYKVDDISFESEIACDEKTLNMLKFMYQNEGYKLEIIGNTINIVTKTSSFKATILSEIIIPELTNTGLIEIKANLMALKKATKFVGKDDTRPALKGVFLQEDGTILASDSFIAYRYQTTEVIDKAKQVILPIAFINAINSTEEIIIKTNAYYASYENDDLLIYTNLIIGDTRFEQIFEHGKRGNSSFVLNDKRELANILGIINNLIDEKIKIIKVNISDLRLSTHLSEIEYHAKINLELTNRTKLQEVGFNLEYFSRIVNSTNGDNLEFIFTDERGIFYLKEEKEDYIMLPVQIRG